jgi:hypothetical protein
MATLRLELGLPGHLFEHSYKLFKQCTTPIYLHRSWEFGNETGLVVKDNQPQLQPRREQDQFLMQAFADNGYKTKDLKLFCFFLAKARDAACTYLFVGLALHGL